MNNYWAFLPMQESSDLLGDARALRERFAADGYLYFKNVIDPTRITSLRRKILTVLAKRGWIKDKPALMKGIACGAPVREGDEEYLLCYDGVQRLQEFHELAHDEDLMRVMRSIVGETAFPHPLKIARLSFPSHYEVSTPPHQDFPNNQGTPNLTAAWIPVGNCPRELGGLAILRGSHRHGVLPLDWHFGAGNRQALVSTDVLEQLRWVTTDFSAGDLLVFGSMTVHVSLHNASEIFMRVSVDFRYQQEGESLTPVCLQPHFERLSWAEVYAEWNAAAYQYYWKDLDYEVVPFEDFPVVDNLLDESDVAAGFAYLRHRDLRLKRRLALLGDLLDPEGPPLDPN